MHSADCFHSVSWAAILIAAADRENPSAENTIERMCHPVLITLVRKEPGEALDDSDAFLRQGQKRDAADDKRPPSKAAIAFFGLMVGKASLHSIYAIEPM